MKTPRVFTCFFLKCSCVFTEFQQRNSFMKSLVFLQSFHKNPWCFHRDLTKPLVFSHSFLQKPTMFLQDFPKHLEIILLFGGVSVESPRDPLSEGTAHRPWNPISQRLCTTSMTPTFLRVMKYNLSV